MLVTATEHGEGFERYRHEVYAWAYRLLGRHHDALDVAQDVFLRWAAQRREAVLRELALFEFQLARVAAIDAACASETAAHAALRTDVDAEVAEARREIAVLRSALEDARLDRRRNEEYETLRRACAKLPKRDATLAACERLEREIAEMEAEEEKAARRFDERRARVDALADAVDALEEDVADDGRAEEEPVGIAADRNVGAVAMETD